MTSAMRACAFSCAREASGSIQGFALFWRSAKSQRVVARTDGAASLAARACKKATVAASGRLMKKMPSSAAFRIAGSGSCAARSRRAAPR